MEQVGWAEERDLVWEGAGVSFVNGDNHGPEVITVQNSSTFWLSKASVF